VNEREIQVIEPKIGESSLQAGFMCSGAWQPFYSLEVTQRSSRRTSARPSGSWAARSRSQLRCRRSTRNRCVDTPPSTPPTPLHPHGQALTARYQGPWRGSQCTVTQAQLGIWNGHRHRGARRRQIVPGAAPPWPCRALAHSSLAAATQHRLLHR